MTPDNDLARAALEYAERGWVVVPLHTPSAGGCSCGWVGCASPAKHPRTTHGLKDASRDPAMIRDWWNIWPEANIGIVTGPESGILALDVDGKPGEESLADFARGGSRLPDTYTVHTGGGGRHLYFLCPEGTEVRNSQSRIAPGLDIRGRGGYVVAPPSLHASGARYEVNELSICPVPCPKWLLSLMQDPQGAQYGRSVPSAGAVARAPIGKGQRTDRLVSLAGTMHRRRMDSGAIEAALLAENTTFTPSLPDAKVRAIARDIPKRYQNPGRLKPDLVCLADVEPRAVDWLWEPFIPLRMLSMISGDPGAGKSFVALSIAADLSRGKLRDARFVDPASTLYLTVENPTAEVMRPRFDTLGGDPKRLHLFPNAVSLVDVDALEAAIIEVGARLIVVDPLQSYLPPTVDLHRSNETRPVMDGLARLAEKHRCAILLLRHLSKQSGGKAIHRGLGSIDLTGAVRSEMLAGSLPDDPGTRAFVHIKSNVGRTGHALGYSIGSDGFRWTGESSITEADLLAAPAASGGGKLSETGQWLADQLRDGAREEKQIRETATTAGISAATLRRAKNVLQVRTRKDGMRGPWMWSLAQDAQAAQGWEVEHLREGMNTFDKKKELSAGNRTRTAEGAHMLELSTFGNYCGGFLQ